MSVRITTVHSDPEGGVLPVLYCRCGREGVENPNRNSEVFGMDYKCPDGHGWVGNIRSEISTAPPPPRPQCPKCSTWLYPEDPSIVPLHAPSCPNWVPYP